ncbi:uncharacterized protein YaiI (UPF0178 family) [Bartonella callosciuri]|uniref:Uncharacterized protein YaiI (UPF0178 family) n=1 Tax=Bartonella callosciuri TaxID=686223 RepID=A0A840P063_9HYPH|nr:uncharacterized protein YaiI (UPF0178 family) [Bartonella callosciuri]
MPDGIVEHVHEVSIVITSDIPLAARVVRAGGCIFNENSIGQALAMCNVLEDLRRQGNMIGGSRPFCGKDHSAFLSALDLAVQR